MNFKEYLKPGESIEFEHLGYFIEFMSGNTYLGAINVTEKDREEIGYYGRQDHVADTDLYLNHGRVIKKGTEFYTRLYPLCGEWLNKPEKMKQNSLK